MDDPGRMGLLPWSNCDPLQLKEFLRDHPAAKLIEVLEERDAAITERDTAIAEKKTAFAERDSALLQRDIAYADRNAALMVRDAALAALSMVRAGKDSSEAAAKLMQMVNSSTVPLSAIEGNIQGVPKLDSKLDQPEKKVIQTGKKASQNKRNCSAVVISNSKQALKVPSKRRHNPKVQHELISKVEKHECPKSNSEAIVPSNLSVTPIPYCSCTGTNQHCYRWGKGGWQSACCTNFLSMYPLPLNPTKRSSRVPGRKMSGGAFKKLLERLAVDGVDITVPIDLKNYWAKHGTNRYVTIK